LENPGRPPQILTAHEAGLVGCTQCGRVHAPGTARCSRCGAPLAPRSLASLQRVWAWLIAGLVVYVGREYDNTIFGGVLELMHHGDAGIALIVFTASIVIPVSKFIAISYLALSVSRHVRLPAHRRHLLYEVVEFIGRWSMIDVFVVAILSALVQLGAVASIHPGPAAASFALSVAFTMLSAQSFDPRLIWRGPAQAKDP
jgi:paraquat-inducible protein A